MITSFVTIVSWICVVIQVYLIIKTYLAWKNIREKGIEYYRKELTKFTELHVKAIEETKDILLQRQNLLSKENSKLIEQNIVLRDKLKNLGFSDTKLDI